MEAARKLTYDELWQEPLGGSKATAEPRLVRKAQPGMAKVTFQAVLCMAIVFAAMILLLVRYSDIAEQKVNVFQMKAEVRKMELTRDELKASLDRGMDLEAIEKTALEKLGMQYPAQTQIVYIEKTALYTLKEPKSAIKGNQTGTVQRWVQSIPWFDKKQAMVPNAE